MDAESTTEIAENNPDQQLALQSLAEAKQKIGDVIREEPIVDDQDLIRTRFIIEQAVSGSVSFVFRGREELPTFTKNGPESTTTDVITTDQPPLFSSEERFTSWLSSNDDVEPTEHTFEEAIESGDEQVEFIATNSPLGIVDVAIRLQELGIGQPEDPQRLKNLRERIAKFEVDDEIMELFDDIYASAAINSESGKAENQPSPDASMIVALALAGVPEARQIIQSKRAISDQLTREIQADNLAYESRQDEINPDKIMVPGEALSDEALEDLKALNLVAVHTTMTDPTHNGEANERGIKPSGEYNLNTSQSNVRPSIHFSLNHPVVSHFAGTFSDRPYTILERIDELAKDNGAPANINGVDSFFDVNPGELLKISPNAKMIELVRPDTDPDHEKPFVEIEGNHIKIRAGNLNSKDMQQLVEILDPETAKNSPELAAKFIAEEMVSKGDIYLNKSAIYHYERDKKELESAEGEEKLHLEQKIAETEELIKLCGELPDDPSDVDYSEGLSRGLAKILSGELNIEDYPHLHNQIVEATRILLVFKLIEQMGGKQVRSDGSSAFLNDDELTRAINDFNIKYNIRGSLHTYTEEAVIEGQVYDVTHEESGANADEGDDWDWSRIDEGFIWEKLKSSPPQLRRHLIRSTLLNFMPQKDLSNNTNDGFDDLQFV